MGIARMLLPTATAALVLAACGGGKRDQGTEIRGRRHRRAQRADSAAHAAKTGAQRVANVMIGKRLGPENRIAEPTFQFAPQDTVYVSVGVQGAPAEGKLSARWLAQTGKTLDSTSTAIAAGRPANKEFHLAPAEGMAARHLSGHVVSERRFRGGKDVRGAEAGLKTEEARDRPGGVREPPRRSLASLGMTGLLATLLAIAFAHRRRLSP